MVGKNSDNQDMFIDVQCMSKEDNANIHIWANHEYFGQTYANPSCLNQEFYLWCDPDDECYTIIPMHTVINEKKKIIEDSPKCIGAENTVAGSKVVQRDLSFDDNFKWAISNRGNGQVEFTLKSTGLKLDVCRATNANGTILHQWIGNRTCAQYYCAWRCYIRFGKNITL